MDLQTFRARVRSRGGFNANDALITNPFLDDVINTALQEFSSEEDWPWFEDTWTFTTIIGQAEYTFASLGTPATNVYQIRAVRVDGEEWPKVSIVDIDAHADTFGWDTYEGQLVLSPTPIGEVDVLVRVHRFEEALVNDADVPLAPDEVQWAVVDLATAFAHDASKDDARGERMKQSYDRKVARIKKRYLDRRTGPRRIRVRPGSPL